MITFKSKREQQMMHKAGQLLAACHKEIAKRIKPGVTTDDIDRFVEGYLKEHGATPEQKGYNGYQYATCASLNDEICHGFPRKTPLKDGDIITIDSVFNVNGALADSAWTYAVGRPSPEAEALMNVTHQALYEGIKQAKVGNRLGDIGHAIQSFVEPKGYSVVRDFTGHGIGPTLHEPPQILHYGSPGKGIRLKEGMVITIEPMVNIGAYQSKLDSNGWTARTVDGSLSAQYEHTLVITANGPLILTDQGDADTYL
ncbi:type I methionyl aminopeptidase [Shouchella lehensis]|uniref:Methionine aminopeptidase n=1 Tax=Shouchella lehensis TaxID=300825 RepID=A0A4Y7WF28_9BACI|nr:type I methionyl aminopeptidase [Shouchella lehensis]MBG9784813.1 methionine aminopeptidase [Shouchella lehensis]RQW18502.1 type I methionyl aminopeptidase [Bacillus sp. C1-1]TES46223.1 type I methionyl aminopeptidase [Shouchella lehensis]